MAYNHVNCAITKPKSSIHIFQKYPTLVFPHIASVKMRESAFINDSAAKKLLKLERNLVISLVIFCFTECCIVGL